MPMLVGQYAIVWICVYDWVYFDELFLRTGNQAAVFLGLVGNFFLTCPTKELITNEFYLKIPKPYNLQGTRLLNRVCTTWQCFLNYCIWPESGKSKHNPINTMSLTAEMLVRFEIRFEKNTQFEYIFNRSISWCNMFEPYCKKSADRFCHRQFCTKD